jgi:hypothetical protein
MPTKSGKEGEEEIWGGGVKWEAVHLLRGESEKFTALKVSEGRASSSLC